MTKTIFLSLPILIFILLLLSCGAKEEINTEPIQQMYDNPFEYCKAVGTIDTPDSEYKGPRVPEIIADSLKREFGASESAPLDVFIKGTYWRCMNGNVYACYVGANLPCQEKGDFSKEPNQGMVGYCEENLGSDFIPMFASGRATVYAWKCDGKTPVIVKQFAETDEAGYLKHIWYEITP